METLRKKEDGSIFCSTCCVYIKKDEVSVVNCLDSIYLALKMTI